MKTILVVDDDTEVLNMVRVVLEEKGFHVTTASDGKACMRDIIVKRPDLIIMDIRMPNMDGLNALDLIRVTQLNREVPIIMWSGEADPETIAKVERLGADDFINKSIPMPEFAKKVASMLLSVDPSTFTEIMKRCPPQKQLGPLPGGLAPEQFPGWDFYPTTFGECEICVLIKPEHTPAQIAEMGPDGAAGKVEILHQLPRRWRRVWPHKA